MKKNAMALAVGALFVVPAAQAQIVFGNDKIGTVQIYGKLYPEVIWFQGNGATQVGAPVSNLVRTNGVLNASGTNGQDHGPRYAVDAQNSYIGFRGERALTPGLKAIWQVEQAVGLDGSGDVWSNRNSFVGLSGGFGTIKLGNMDTIYKEYGDVMQLLGVSSGNFVSASNVLSHIGVGNNNAARFHERAKNSIQYQTREFGGLQAGVQYSPDEAGNDPSNIDSTTGAILRPGGMKADLWSFGVKYDVERFYLSVQHEIHQNFFGGSMNVGNQVSNIPSNVPFPQAEDAAGNPVPNVFVGETRAFRTESLRSNDHATRVTGEYRLGSVHRLVAEYSWLRWSESGQGTGTRFKDLEKNTWTVGWDARWTGSWRTAIQYVHANAGKCHFTVGDCNTDGLEGKMISLGAGYSYDRQTMLYALANKLWNGASARYDNWANGSPSRGEDMTQLAVGIVYSF